MNQLREAFARKERSQREYFDRLKKSAWDLATLHDCAKAIVEAIRTACHRSRYWGSVMERSEGEHRRSRSFEKRMVLRKPPKIPIQIKAGRIA